MDTNERAGQGRGQELAARGERGRAEPVGQGVAELSAAQVVALVEMIRRIDWVLAAGRR